MPKLDKAERRERQQFKARRGMRVSNRNLKTVILRINEKKSIEARLRREQKENARG